MGKKELFGIFYVSLWVVIWGTVGSLVDLPFLNSGIYVEGSIGQWTTFILTGLISFIIGFWLYPKILKIDFIMSMLGLTTD